MNQIKLSDHFTYRKLFRFTLPSILMMIFTSIYGMVDGFFVSNYTGKTSFAAINLIYPYIGILGALGFMIGTGGAAVVGRMLGQQQRDEANRNFSMFVWVSTISGLIFVAIGLITIRPAARLLGATPEMLDDCVLYGSMVLCGTPFFMLQFMFQTFFSTAEKPKLGLVDTIAAGCTNMVLDWLLVGVFGLGLVGAASATVMSQVVGGLIPIFYFARKNTSLLRLVKPTFSLRTLLKACGNGSSEFLSSIAMSLVGMLFNLQLIKYYGEDGVSAYGVIMYVSFIFAAIFIGYAMGSAPIVSYQFGAENKVELKNLFGKSMKLIPTLGAAMTVIAFVAAGPLARIFVGYDKELCDLTVHALRIFSLSFLLMGVNNYGSGFFTALNNGLVSAIISFARTFVFQIAAVMLLPLIIGKDGVWWSMIVCEVLSLTVTAFFLITNRKKYGYA